jgi:hypothetical protein
MIRVVLQIRANPVDQSTVESGFVAISGEVDTCSISTGDGWIWVGKEQVWKQFWVAVRRRIEDLVESSGTRLRLGGLNNTRSICAIYELPEHI